MPYIPNWEPIYIALKRMILAGQSEAQAKLDLCGIIADRKIELRAIVQGTDSEEERTVTTPFSLRHPLRLNPDEMDWENSAPKNVWEVNNFGFFLRQKIILLEILTSDLRKLFPSTYELKHEVVKSTGKANMPSHAEAERKYAQRRETLGVGAPTEAEDLKWGASEGISQSRIKEFRTRHVNRRRGRPLKNG
jgi:hypothetical protein